MPMFIKAGPVLSDVQRISHTDKLKTVLSQTELFWEAKMICRQKNVSLFRQLQYCSMLRFLVKV